MPSNYELLVEFLGDFVDNGDFHLNKLLLVCARFLVGPDNASHTQVCRDALVNWVETLNSATDSLTFKQARVTLNQSYVDYASGEAAKIVDELLSLVSGRLAHKVGDLGAGDPRAVVAFSQHVIVVASGERLPRGAFREFPIDEFVRALRPYLERMERLVSHVARAYEEVDP